MGETKVCLQGKWKYVLVRSSQYLNNIV